MNAVTARSDGSTGPLGKNITGAENQREKKNPTSSFWRISLKKGKKKRAIRQNLEVGKKGGSSP